MVVLLVAGLALAEAVRIGYGRVLTATTAVGRIDANGVAGDWGTSCSVLVTGTNTVYFMKNCGTNDFVLSKAIPVAAGTSYEFSRGWRIYNVVYATATGGSTFSIAFE